MTKDEVLTILDTQGITYFTQSEMYITTTLAAELLKTRHRHKIWVIVEYSEEFFKDFLETNEDWRNLCRNRWLSIQFLIKCYKRLPKNSINFKHYTRDEIWDLLGCLNSLGKYSYSTICYDDYLLFCQRVIGSRNRISRRLTGPAQLCKYIVDFFGSDSDLLRPFLLIPQLDAFTFKNLSYTDICFILVSGRVIDFQYILRLREAGNMTITDDELNVLRMSYALSS